MTVSARSLVLTGALAVSALVPCAALLRAQEVTELAPDASESASRPASVTGFTMKSKAATS